MVQAAIASSVTHYDRLFRLIQKRVADRIHTPFEIRLWGDLSYSFGKGEPAIEILVRDRDGLSALSGLDEVKICEAYMAGNLDVVGDMLGFVSLRRALSDRHPLHTLWRRIAPVFIGRGQADRQAIASHCNRHSYYLTCKAWANNLESAREEIIHRWGEMLYRRFRLYLWGSAYAFLSRGMDAYRVILQRSGDI